MFVYNIVKITVSSLHTVAPYNVTITKDMVNNDIVTYTCYADGGPGNSYQWLRLRDNKVVSMTQELTLSNTDPMDRGDYQCTITNIADNATLITSLNSKTLFARTKHLLIMAPSCLEKDVITFCIIWSSKQPELILFGYLAIFRSCPPSACGIDYVRTSSKMTDNSTNYSLKS